MQHDGIMDTLRRHFAVTGPLTLDTRLRDLAKSRFAAGELGRAMGGTFGVCLTEDEYEKLCSEDATIRTLIEIVGGLG